MQNPFEDGFYINWSGTETRYYIYNVDGKLIENGTAEIGKKVGKNILKTLK